MQEYEIYRRGRIFPIAIVHAYSDKDAIAIYLDKAGIMPEVRTELIRKNGYTATPRRTA